MPGLKLGLAPNSGGAMAFRWATSGRLSNNKAQSVYRMWVTLAFCHPCNPGRGVIHWFAMEQDRRTFLTSALAAAPLFVPRSAWGANDRLAYGLIGAGGRGRYLNQN